MLKKIIKVFKKEKKDDCCKIKIVEEKDKEKR